MQHGTSYSSTHSFETLHFLFESRFLFIWIKPYYIIEVSLEEIMELSYAVYK